MNLHPYFRLVINLVFIGVSIGVILPYLFSGSTESVIAGFVYLIIFPWILWRWNVGKITSEPEEFVIGKEDK